MVEGPGRRKEKKRNNIIIILNNYFYYQSCINISMAPPQEAVFKNIIKKIKQPNFNNARPKEKRIFQ